MAQQRWSADVEFNSRHDLRSWGRIGNRIHHVARPRFADDVRRWNAASPNSRLAVGKLRSYSDVCLANEGRIVDMTGLDRIRSFDPATGVLVAEAGLTLDALLKTFVPMGFFVPVTPGTRFVTLGGAVANDVHGKNHHRAGTFGRHIRRLILERSDEGTLGISPSLRADLFAATIGGLGLTGIITEVELQLAPIASSQLEIETAACGGLDQVCDGLDAGSTSEHSVAWIDCTASGSNLGRGIVTTGEWAKDGILRVHTDQKRSMPTDRLGGLLNRLTLRTFNQLYHANGRRQSGRAICHYDPFLYPLDSILHWNRLYGRSGFYQYQCVIPDAAGREPVRALLKEIAKSGEGSFLAVLKRFGDLPSPGILSFPMPGLTLALDFRNRERLTLDLLARLDAIVTAAGGRHYAAKDIRMPSEAFVRGYPGLDQFRQFVDPVCNSDFKKRIGL